MAGVSEFIKAKDPKECDGCSRIIYPSETYIHSRFTLNDPGSNVVRFISVFICNECLFDFDDFTHDPNTGEK